MKILILLSILVLSACSSTSEISSSAKPTDIIQLIEKAKKRFPEGVRGTFQILIQASGSERGITYLNSDLDYRDPKNITIVIAPSIIELFTKTYGSQPASYFINKTIKVKGKVERIKISMFENGKRSKKYYYQTHIKVTSIDQIKVLS
jgi:hypothetical protein